MIVFLTVAQRCEGVTFLFLLELRATLIRLRNTITAGILSELRFKTEALARGYEVFDPVHPASSADCVVWKPGSTPLLVQVKKARRTPAGTWRFTACRVGRKKADTVRTSYKAHDFDVFAVHVEDGADHSFVFIPLQEVYQRECLTFRAGAQGKELNNWHRLDEDQ